MYAFFITFSEQKENCLVIQILRHWTKIKNLTALFSDKKGLKLQKRFCVSFESFPFVDVGVQECCFLIGNFSRKFDRRVMIVCLFNEMFYSVSVCSPERKDVVYVTFPNERF